MRCQAPPRRGCRAAARRLGGPRRHGPAVPAGGHLHLGPRQRGAQLPGGLRPRSQGLVDEAKQPRGLARLLRLLPPVCRSLLCRARRLGVLPPTAALAAALPLPRHALAAALAAAPVVVAPVVAVALCMLVAEAALLRQQLRLHRLDDAAAGPAQPATGLVPAGCSRV
jgi:hypothetical protein